MALIYICRLRLFCCVLKNIESNQVKVNNRLPKRKWLVMYSLLGKLFANRTSDTRTPRPYYSILASPTVYGACTNEHHPLRCIS